MTFNDKKIPKTIFREIKDLRDHVFLLDNAIKMSRTNKTFIKPMAHELRVLLIKSKGQEPLLLRLAKKFDFELIYKSRTSYRPEKFTNKKYINRLQNEFVIVNSESYPIQRFIRLMANEGGGSHEPKEVGEMVSYGEKLLIQDISANNHLLLAEAKRTLTISKEFLEYLDSLDKEEIQKRN